MKIGWLKAAVLGVLGTGIVGNGVIIHTNNQENKQTISKLSEELTSANGANESLSTMLTQNQDLVKALQEALQQDQATMQGLASKVDKLDAQITIDEIMGVVDKVTPSTVRVEGPFALGSGVIIKDNEGRRFILTNGHVTQFNDFIKGEFKDSVYHIKLYNGTDFENPIEFDAAPVMLSDGQRAYSDPEQYDLALLQIPADIKLPDNAGVEMRDMANNPIKVGEGVITVGNPFGERDSVGFGIVSHNDRYVDLDKDHHIQTDAPINPGNSGGGLFDMQGRLIGINTWGYSNSGGVGGSIRIDYIRMVLEGWGIPVMNINNSNNDDATVNGLSESVPNIA